MSMPRENTPRENNEAAADEAAADEVAADEAVHRARAVVQSLYLADLASQSLGIEIVDVAPGQVQIAMTVRPDMVNGFGMCHGGIVFAFADSAFAFACNSYGERVTGTAREISRSARHGIYDVAVTAAAGTVLAQFRGRCARLRGPAP